MEIPNYTDANEYTQLRCPICLGGKLIKLDFPLKQSMRSDGFIIGEPLIKHHCPDCGLLIGGNGQGEPRYLRSNGDSPFDLARHQNVAEGLSRLIDGVKHKQRLTIIEVGAANFQTALSLKKINPDYSISALEPHPETLPESNEISTIIKDFLQLEEDDKFDICYSNQVIEHFKDPIIFLKKSKAILKDTGIIIACCPTFKNVSSELLFSDHFSHFTPDAMAICAERAGLVLASDFLSDWDPLTHVYVFEVRNNSDVQGSKLPTDYEPLRLQRSLLINQWLTEEKKLLEIFESAEKIMIFGAGEFTQLIRAYMPVFWHKVDKILVDNLCGIRDFDKPVLHIEDIQFGDRDSLLIGAQERSRQAIFQKILDHKVSATNVYIPSI